jgi:hypothetical protein
MTIALLRWTLKYWGCRAEPSLFHGPGAEPQGHQGKPNYLHNNPVRNAFVEKPENWKYSSATNWMLDDDSVIAIDRQKVFGEG